MYNVWVAVQCDLIRSVFVGNIPYEATEEKLKDIFSQAGSVGEILYLRMFTISQNKSHPRFIKFITQICSYSFLYQLPSNWYMIERRANPKAMASVNTRYSFVMAGSISLDNFAH